MSTRLKAIFMSSLRMYFAPLTGAIKGACQAVKDESERRNRELRS